MQFLAPAALLAVVPLGGIIILLYLLRLRRREVVIPSVLLWRRAVEDVQANAPFQKLRRNLLLFLQLMALTAVVAGLAAPFFLGHRLAGKSTVIVLDASASMRATDVPGSRFEEAKRRAAQVVRTMGRRDEAALVMSAARAWVAMPFSGEQRLLLGAIQAAQPTDDPTHMRDGLLLALSLARKRPEARVYVISDGAFPALADVQSPVQIQFLRVGAANDNVALLAFEAARPPASREHQLFVRMSNFAPEPRKCVLSIYHEDDLLDAQEMELRPGENRVETYKMALREAGLLRAELDVDDDLAADNVAYASAEPPSSLAVLLVTSGNLFIEQALSVLPDVQVYRANSLSTSDASSAYAKYGAILFDKVAPPELPASGAVMLIATDSPGAPATLGPALADPAVTQWETQHPVLRYVNLGAVQISKGRALQPAPGATVLSRAGDQPVIVAQERPGLRALAFGWDFLDSDLPLRVGFPVLLSNAIRWLAEAGGGARLMTVRPGTMLRFAAPPEAAQAQVILPDQRRQRLAVTEGETTFTDADRVGIYRLTAGDREWRFAVDLRSAEESDLTPKDELKLGERKVEAGVGAPRVQQHLWPYLALLALGLLLAEWHLYHRRY